MWVQLSDVWLMAVITLHVVSTPVFLIPALTSVVLLQVKHTRFSFRE